MSDFKETYSQLKIKLEALEKASEDIFADPTLDQKDQTQFSVAIEITKKLLDIYMGLHYLDDEINILNSRLKKLENKISDPFNIRNR